MSIISNELKNSIGKFAYFNDIEGKYTEAHYIVDFDDEFVKSYTYTTWEDLNSEELRELLYDIPEIAVIRESKRRRADNKNNRAH